MKIKSPFPLIVYAVTILAACWLNGAPQTMHFRHGASGADPTIADATSVQRTTLIRSDQPDTGAPDVFFITGGAGTGRALRGLLQFDLSALPEDAIVTAASLQLRTLPNADGGSLVSDVAFAIHALDKQPVVSEATWNIASGGLAWDTPGGDYSGPPAAETVVNTSSDLYADIRWSTEALTALVAAAAAGDEVLDLLLKAPDSVESSQDRALVWFYSATSTQNLTERPLLTVEYTGEAPPPPPDDNTDPTLGQGAPEIDDAAITDFIHADPVTGSDGNDGSDLTPVRTVSRALQLANAVNAAGRPVKVILAAGEYHENSPDMGWSSGMINIPGFKSAAPVIIEGHGWSPGVNTGDVIITGSEIWTGWSDDGGSFSKAWPYGDWGVDPSASGPDVLRRFEAVFVDENGDGSFVPYYQMEGPDDPYRGNLYPDEGYFFLDLENSALHVVPPAGVDLNSPGVTVRVSTRKRLMYLYHPSLTPTPGHIVVRNLVFEHSGSTACYFQNAMASTVEDCVFRQNKHLGLAVESYVVDGRTTIRRSVVEENGVYGFGGDFSNSLAEDLVIRRNGRHAYIREYFGWATCGMKLGQGHRVTFRRWLVEGNFGHGMWLDTNIVDMEVYDSVFRYNVEGGIFLENNNRNTVADLGDRTTVTVRENIFYENIAPQEPLAVDPSKFRTGKAIQFAEHENGVVKNNLMYGNERVFHCSHNVRGPMENNVIRWNLVAAPSWAINMGIYGGQLQAWRDFVDTLTNETDYNYYYQDAALPFIDRNLAAVDFESHRAMLQGNLFNPFAKDTIEAGSVHVRADYPGTPLVVVSAFTPELTEGEVGVPTFRIKRLAPGLESELVVSVAFREQAGDIGAADLLGSLPATVTIPAGEAFAFVEVSPVADGLAEGPEQLAIELLPGAGYLLGESTAEATVLDVDAPDLNQVSVEARVSHVYEGTGSVNAFRISRNGDISSQLEVSYSVGGTAVMGLDFEALSGKAVIPADADEVDLVLSLIDDTIAELLKTITITLQPTETGAYVLRSPVQAQVSLVDNDLVSPMAIHAEAGTGDGPLQVPVSIKNPGPEAMTYNLSVPQGYQLRDSDSATPAHFNWIDIAAPENKIGFQWIFPNDDGLSAALPLGFEFAFFGETFASVYVHSNGFLTFTEQRRNFSTNRSLPDDDNRTPSNLVAPFWRNLGMDAESGVYAQQIEGVFVVQFDDMIAFPAFINKKRVTFQVLLHANGMITFNYRDNDTGISHTIGIQNSDKSEAILVAHNESYVRSELALQFIPVSGWFKVPAQGIAVPALGQQDALVTMEGEHLPFGTWTTTLLLQPVDSTEPALEIPVSFSANPPSGVWATALPLGGGWIFSDWFGLFLDYPGLPGWIGSLEHGPLYAHGDNPSGFWIWSGELGWCWLSDAAYPYFYSARHQSWVYYVAHQGVALQRFFYIYQGQRWVSQL